MLLKVTDFRVAGFLLARDCKFLRTEMKGTQVVFVFEDDNAESTEVLNSYPNSAERKYDSACKTMHNMVKIAKDNSK